MRFLVLPYFSIALILIINFFNLSQKIVKDLLLRPKPLPVLFISFERGFILAIIAICLWLSIPRFEVTNLYSISQDISDSFIDVKSGKH